MRMVDEKSLKICQSVYSLNGVREGERERGKERDRIFTINRL